MLNVKEILEIFINFDRVDIALQIISIEHRIATIKKVTNMNTLKRKFVFFFQNFRKPDGIFKFLLKS